jgi:hypothetical protein
MAVRLIKPIKLITVVLLVSLLLLGMAPAKALGGTGYKIEGESNGLIIASPLAPEDTGNLGPGDQKHSRLKLTNTNTSPVTVYIRTVIVEEDTPPGGADLADGMFLTIKDGDTVICSGTFRDADEKGNISLGSMAPDEENILDFYADFPEDSGNEYQGASMKVQWVFTTQTSDDGGGGGGGGSRRRDRGGDEEEITVEEPDIFVPPEEPITVEEPVTVEDLPLPGMPKTGEGLPYPYYLAGACAIVAGIGLLRNKSKS